MKGFLVLLLLALCPLTALAGPPFVTDDPEPVDYQHWEFYIASQHIETSDGWSGTAPHVELNYGAVTNLQLHLIAPLAYDNSRERPSHYGYGDTEIGAKYRFMQETEHLPQVGIFPLLELPSGSESAGLGGGHVQAFLPVWLQKSWGEEEHKWTAYGGGGYDINPGAGNRDWTFFGLVLQRQITDRVLIGGEIYHRTATIIGERADTAFNLGTVIDFSHHHHLLFSAGRSIVGPTEFQVYVAYQLTLGPAK
jgi:Putative MetA-pathway of phenol degradation